MKTTLIIGGTSGLGLELAKKLAARDEKVIITGRQDPEVDKVEYKKFDLSSSELVKRVDESIANIVEVDRLIYAAGFFQEGTLTDLSEEQIEEMMDVGGRGLIYFLRALLIKQNKLDELITITSTSQWIPRKLEPIYNFVKAGAGHLSNAIAEDGRVGKVLVAGPAGMRSEFWDGIARDDLDQMLDPAWVANEMLKAASGDYNYKYIRILRQPARVEEVEKR